MLRAFPVIVLFMFFLVSCSDSEQKEIEGRWQLRQMTSPAGKVSEVDTIFYSFKKNVFEYRQLDTSMESSGCFGMYSLENDKLEITVDDESYFPDDCEPYLDWENATRIYDVRNTTSSKMDLEYAGIIYSFRKY